MTNQSSRYQRSSVFDSRIPVEYFFVLLYFFALTLSYLIFLLDLTISPIPDQPFLAATKEVVLTDTSGATVSHILFALPKDFPTVYKHLKTCVDTTLGISREHARIAKEYLDYENSFHLDFDSAYAAQSRLVFDSTKRFLRSIDVQLDSVVQHTIFTKGYNRNSSIAGHSTLRIDLYDGSRILRTTCTIITFLRFDEFQSFGVLGRTGIPLPFKGPTSRDNLTETELGIARSVSIRLQAGDIRWYVPSDISTPLMDIALMRTIKQSMTDKNR